MKNLIVDGVNVCADIVEYIEAKRNYTLIKLVDGSKLISSKNLGKVAKYLNLVRIHRGIAVNLNHIEYSLGVITTKSGFVTEPSRRQNKKIESQLITRIVR